MGDMVHIFKVRDFISMHPNSMIFVKKEVHTIVFVLQNDLKNLKQNKKNSNSLLVMMDIVVISPSKRQRSVSHNEKNILFVSKFRKQKLLSSTI